MNGSHPHGSRSPAASIVIPFLDADDTIGEQLDSIHGQVGALPVEIIVVDNGSSTPARARLTRIVAEVPGVRVVDGAGERGASFARNVGARHATASLLIFVDADDVVAPGWLAAYLAEPPRRGLLAGAVDEWTLARFPTWGAATSGSRPPRTMRGHLFAISANFAIGADLFDELGGFGPSPGGGVGEDVALSWAAERLGVPIRFVATAIVQKRQRSTRRALFARFVRYGRSAPALERLYPEHAGRARVSEWARPRSELVGELAATLRHPVKRQGVVIQLVGLAVGRVWGAVDGVRRR